MATKQRTMYWIIGVQLMGFVGIALLVWADERFDFANVIFGQPKAPYNTVEALTESSFILVFGVGIALWSRRVLLRIRYLEGFISLCAFCKKVRVGESWVPLEVFLGDHSDARLSHGFCPACAEEHYGEYLRNRKEPP